MIHKLIELRKFHKVSVSEMASHLGISRSMLSRLEKKEDMKLGLALRYASYLGYEIKIMIEA
jgi:transcriptional regulator with XRE-family HTH domain